jgi:hypothetical protein
LLDLDPDSREEHTMKNGFHAASKRPFFGVMLLALLTAPVHTEQSARDLLDKARQRAASAPSLKRVDASEVVVTGPGGRALGTQKNVVTIEIDLTRNLARQTCTYEGKELVMIKQGQNAAMKLGSGDWQVPVGSFAQLARDVGNLFVCEAEVPENEKNTPKWVISGKEVVNGREAVVIESEGNSAIPIAQERMSAGLAKAIGDAAQRPSIKVLSYSAKHWIDKADFRHLQALQKSKVQLTLPGGNLQVTQEMTTLSTYSYENVDIQIPERAQQLLAGPATAP